MIQTEQGQDGGVALEKLKAYLQRNNLVYTEEHKGNTTIIEIKRKEKEEGKEEAPHHLHPGDKAS